ncbi:hypothetical protein C0991_003228 [Blastosporella zonata]|nr:hypothetical protein C0991_003228 [Blastosporella zonata]
MGAYSLESIVPLTSYLGQMEPFTSDDVLNNIWKATQVYAGEWHNEPNNELAMPDNANPGFGNASIGQFTPSHPNFQNFQGGLPANEYYMEYTTFRDGVDTAYDNGFGQALQSTYGGNATIPGTSVISHNEPTMPDNTNTGFGNTNIHQFTPLSNYYHPAPDFDNFRGAFDANVHQRSDVGQAIWGIDADPDPAYYNAFGQATQSTYGAHAAVFGTSAPYPATYGHHNAPYTAPSPAQYTYYDARTGTSEEEFARFLEEFALFYLTPLKIISVLIPDHHNHL